MNFEEEALEENGVALVMVVARLDQRSRAQARYELTNAREEGAFLQATSMMFTGQGSQVVLPDYRIRVIVCIISKVVRGKMSQNLS